MTDNFLVIGAGWICGLLILALIVGVAIRAMTSPGGNNGESESEDKALEILRKRYAAGDITEEEFEHMKEELEH